KQRLQHRWIEGHPVRQRKIQDHRTIARLEETSAVGGNLFERPVGNGDESVTIVLPSRLNGKLQLKAAAIQPAFNLQQFFEPRFPPPRGHRGQAYPKLTVVDDRGK